MSEAAKGPAAMGGESDSDSIADYADGENTGECLFSVVVVADCPASTPFWRSYHLLERSLLSLCLT